MDFKKQMIIDYSTKLNEILGNYKTEYHEIMKKTIQPVEIVDVSVTEEIAQSRELVDLTGNVDFTHQEMESRIIEGAQENVSYRFIEPVDVPRTDVAALTTKCVIESTMLVDQTDLFDNSVNLNGQVISHSFLGGERRKARRKTGKKIVKRKLDVDDFYPCKKVRTDKMSNPLDFYREIKNESMCTASPTILQEIADLKEALKKRELENNEKMQAEKMVLEKIREENLLISAKIQADLQELQLFKHNLMSEMKRIERVKEKEGVFAQVQQEQEQKRLEQEKKLEEEKKIIAEEKRRLEAAKIQESDQLKQERQRIEREKAQELQRLAEEKRLFEEQTKKLENERKLLQEERERMQKIFEDERQRINQTFLEITNRQTHDVVPMGSSREVHVKLPVGFVPETVHKQTLARQKVKTPNDVFQEIKRETNRNTAAWEKQPNRNMAVLDVGRFDPHELYKKSIDVQTNSADPKKYLPKTSIPLYASEDEFDADDKKYNAALFTKDPKLNYTVKHQNHNEIRAFFGNSMELDVERIFGDIENVSNFSPNKLKKKNK